MDGTLGVVEVPEDGLPGAASAIMERVGVELRLRVCFWEGRRVNDKLYKREVFCEIYDDGAILDAEAIARNDSDGPSRPPQTARPGCPHAPHDGACGHKGSCMFAHHQQECEAVRLVCPACFEEERPRVIPDIVELIRRQGELVLRCSACELLSFQLDADLICDMCEWFVPQVNEELEDRFAANNGPFAPRPGSCPGCGQQMPRPDDIFSLGCPKCGQDVTLPLESTAAGMTINTMCRSRECGQYITIPSAIWCQECGKNLRPMDVVRKLTLEANDVRLASRSNVREDEDTRTARSLAVAAESSTRRYDYLSDDQRRLLRDKAYLDEVAFSSVPPAEWLRDIIQIRRAGHEINRRGGMRAMQEMHQRVMELGVAYRGAARHIELYWDGIGDWLG